MKIFWLSVIIALLSIAGCNFKERAESGSTVQQPSAGAERGGGRQALIGMGIPEYEAKRYEGKIESGNILISVHTRDSRERNLARRIFDEAGADGVSYTGEARPSA